MYWIVELLQDWKERLQDMALRLPNTLDLPSSDSPFDQNRLEVFAKHRCLLLAIAYRMLSSLTEAEEALRETNMLWLLATDAEIPSPRTFLVTSISRLCINRLQAARVEREEYIGQWLPEPLVTEPHPGSGAAFRLDESLSIGFLAPLEELTPVERAVFLLHDVFEYEYSDIARILGQNELNCQEVLRRVREHLAHIRPRFDPAPRQHEKVLREFLETTAQGDTDGLLALLADQIGLYSDGGGKAAVAPSPINSQTEVASLMIDIVAHIQRKNVIRRIVQINGQGGIVHYLAGRPVTVISLDVADGRIRSIYIVRNPEKLARVPELSELPAAPN